MTKKINKDRKEMHCPTCNKEVLAIKKVFSTYICSNCNKILSSDIGIEKAGI